MLFRELDRVRVKGKFEVNRIFEPICAKAQANEAVLDRLDRHDQALKAYYARDWVKAKQLFRELSDGEGYYDFILRRIDSLEQHPPPADWDGVTGYSSS